MLMLLMSLAASACALLVDGRKPLPFELRDNAILVPVYISGQGPFRFLLDTGASRSVVSERLARRVGGGTNERIAMITPTGRSAHAGVRLSLRLGDHDDVPLTAIVIRDEELARAGSTADGIVGQDVLASLVYTIDYRRRLIFWDQQLPSSAADRLALDLSGGKAIVTIPAHGDMPRPLRMIPDSGTDAMVLFARRNGVLPPATPLDVGTLRTLTGPQLVRRVRLDRLEIGGVRLEHHDAVILNEGRDIFPPGDGLLPLHIFSRVTINGPGGFIVVAR